MGEIVGIKLDPWITADISELRILVTDENVGALTFAGGCSHESNRRKLGI
jgi:hypothetical protein